MTERGHCPVCGSALWSTTDVAEFLGVALGTISSYRARGEMPPPDGRIGRTRVWLPSTIRGWRLRDLSGPAEGFEERLAALDERLDAAARLEAHNWALRGAARSVAEAVNVASAYALSDHEADTIQLAARLLLRLIRDQHIGAIGNPPAPL